MNRQIAHLFGFFVLLFALLVVFTSRWSVFEAEGLEDNTANRRPLLEEQRIPRGIITTRDGRRLAVNQARGNRQTRRFERRYPEGSLFSHAIGYSFVTRGRSGLEKSQNDFLTGRESEFASLVDELSGRRVEGDDIRTTLDSKGQQAARQALGSQRGSIVALEPATGRIRVMVSQPDFDPNDVPERFRELNADKNSPIFNRATQARYPPGSTFKAVTAAAAIDSGRYRPDSVVDGRNGQRVSGVPLSNFGNEDYGPIDLTEALTNSVNTVWGQVGARLGSGTMYRYMKRFGFNEEPPLDYPREQLTPSGVFGRRGRLLDDDDPVDIGRVAIGQERLQVTPLQMAMVAAAIGNDGALMTPRLTERITGPDGRIKERIRPEEQQQVISASSARDVQKMMNSVVEEGSGTAAKLKGVPVGGKTGTAEVEAGATNQAWFIAFAPLDNPRIAIAATVERTQGTGGEVAAPIARRVLEQLLGAEGAPASDAPAAGGF